MQLKYFAMRDGMAANELEMIREAIADVDEQIIAAVSKRMQLALSAAEFKRRQNCAIRDSQVEKVVIDRIQSLAQEAGLPPGLAEELAKILIKYSVLIQNQHK